MLQKQPEGQEDLYKFTWPATTNLARWVRAPLANKYYDNNLRSNLQL